MDKWPDSLNGKWSYDHGVMLEGVDAVWKRTANPKYFNYIQHSMDFFVDKEGNLNRYKATDFNIDNVKNGRSLLTLYKVTLQPRYFKAATVLWNQLQSQPRTKEGGFWHKKIYPNQMWLDGLYMGEPFYAEYAALTNNHSAFDDIANQFIWMENHARDKNTGLMYHGWDESKQERWADKTTGLSANFWARAMGWYGMALVDVLDYFPKNHPKHGELVAILNRFAQAVNKVQDQKTGLWYDVLDKPTAKGNYLESSASAMFVYTFAKGVRKGYLPNLYSQQANKAFEGMKHEFVEQAGTDKINLKGTVAVSGLGGKPKYRDGSFEYYISEKVITNDPKGIGAFVLACDEMERQSAPKPAAGKHILLDSYFNNEFREDQSGNQLSYHYKWEERDNNGFSFLEQIFEDKGATTRTLYQAPTSANLKNADVYIIVDPDDEKETEKPNKMTPASVEVLDKWVNAGGVLVLMANDGEHCELKSFNLLANNFGLKFNNDNKGQVTVKGAFEMAKIAVGSTNQVFKKPMDLYIKEYSSISLSKGASALLKDKDGDVVMAVAKKGRGAVFAIGDPWLYNEYVDGRKLPANYRNFDAAQALADWLLTKVGGAK